MMTKVTDTAALAEFAKYEVPFPFFREEWMRGFDTDWRIGVRERPGNHGVSDGMGMLIITTLAIVSPGGKYARRAFYTQSWRDPDGREFGSPGLRCDSVSSVQNKLKGFKGTFDLYERTPNPPPPVAALQGWLRLVGSPSSP
jgi:hypothetical protein